MNYSTTQGSNIVIVLGAALIIATKIQDLSSITGEDMAQIAAALTIIGGAITSFVSRFKKGDVTLGGFKKF